MEGLNLKSALLVTGFALFLVDSALADEWMAYGRDPNATVCKLRLFEVTLDTRLIALDAATGAPCPGFSAGGQFDLRGVDSYRNGWHPLRATVLG